ncbi:MAG: hypothetical protein J07HX5_01907 [halophilic archaeon J07HX5]|nr:MAG: hypothetical protein J07HX5_01907 [halophilic archaeon J07HX5]
MCSLGAQFMAFASDLSAPGAVIRAQIGPDSHRRPISIDWSVIGVTHPPIGVSSDQARVACQVWDPVAGATDLLGSTTRLSRSSVSVGTRTCNGAIHSGVGGSASD